MRPEKGMLLHSILPHSLGSWLLATVELELVNCLPVRLCVCMREREGGRERESQSVCVCVCVSEREREREKGGVCSAAALLFLYIPSSWLTQYPEKS